MYKGTNIKFYNHFSEMSEVTIALNQDREMSILCDANKFLANISYHNYNSDQYWTYIGSVVKVT